MRVLAIFLLCSVLRLSVHAQTPKTIPGVFRGEFWDDDWTVLQVAPGGKSVVFEHFRKFYTLHLDGGYFAVDTPEWFGRLSPDHRYSFTNLPKWGDGIVLGNPKSFTGPDLTVGYAAMLCSFPEGKVIRYFTDTNYILGMTPENNLIVTSAIIEKEGRDKDRINYLIGLRTIEPRTGRVEKILRTDTLFRSTFGAYIPRLWFNTTFSALLVTSKNVSGQIIVYPFGSNAVIHTGASTALREHFMADGQYLYEEGRSGLSVFSQTTGKLLFTASCSPTAANPPNIYKRCYYALGEEGKIYRFDRETSIAYEEEVTPGGLHTLRTFPIAPDDAFRLANDQWYSMSVAAGPSLVLVPRFRRDGDQPANRGYVIDLTGGKVSLIIAPFFNPDAGQLAQEAAVAEANRAFEAQTAAAKKANCDKHLAGLGLALGNSVSASYMDGVLRSYDCERDVYTIWIPKEHRNAVGDKTKMIYGWSFRKDWKKSTTPYHPCGNCNGAGYLSHKETRSRTKEVPQGYFSGIETKVTRTWEETVTETCRHCGGEGIVK